MGSMFMLLQMPVGFDLLACIQWKEQNRPVHNFMNLTVILCICLFFAGYEPFYLNYLVVQTTAYFSGKKKSLTVYLQWVSESE